MRCVTNASLGVYAKVVQSDACRDAKLETWTRILPDLLDPPLRVASLPRGVGVAPAARAVGLTTGNLGGLVRVAAG